jgi:undecaprenyl diphosphate synthase
MIVGFIADGNRRWAKANGFSAKEGHKAGFRAISDEILPACFDHPQCKGLAVYAFSTENWSRSPIEVQNLFALYEEMVEEWREKFREKKIALKWAGKRTRIPSSLKKKIEQLESETKEFAKSFTVYLCLDYGAKDELVRSIKKIQDKTISEKNLETMLEVPPLDLIIRSGGEKRLSNFCLWQSAYAELFFEDDFLPDFTRAKMENIFERFFERERRRGK